MLELVKENSSDFSGACNRIMLLIKLLRSPGGCPWDKTQTPKSMLPCLIEEVFEVVDAVSRKDLCNVREELGDILFNILLTAYMYEQNGDFSIADVLNEVTDKLIRRHPHVFSNKEFVLGLWDSIKKDAEGRKKDSVLDEVPEGFPPLLKAYKYLKKASKEHFDWKDVKSVEEKVKEEFLEVKEAASVNDIDHLEEEIGDLLLSVVNLSRFYKIDPSVALSRANKKFSYRFKYVEKEMKSHSLSMTEDHLLDMERFWEEAKTHGDIVNGSNHS
ncbi:MAG: nucleoside triphosphate pyrophosphohydrolase [Treponema sp.]|nr:nucleoside triphosphate pyrophosphohydrolase [Treponema sp.]